MSGTFTAVCRWADLEPEKPVRFDVDGRPLAVVRIDTEAFAIYDECSHAQVPLSEGEVEDCAIECWLHGSAFDLRTGAPRSLPAITPVPVYATRIVGDGPDAIVEVSVDPISTHEGAL